MFLKADYLERLSLTPTVSGQLVDVEQLVLVDLLPDHLVEGFGVEDDGVVEVRGVDRDVDGEVEHRKHDLGEVERLKLVVLANFSGKLCRVDPENVWPGLQGWRAT